MKLKNNQGLKIEITETDNMVIVTLNGSDYAVFQDCIIDWINTDKLVNWIENTYYDDCYLSDQYIVPSLRLEEFSNDSDKYNPTSNDSMREG